MSITLDDVLRKKKKHISDDESVNKAFENYQQRKLNSAQNVYADLTKKYNQEVDLYNKALESGSIYNISNLRSLKRDIESNANYFGVEGQKLLSSINEWEKNYYSQFDIAPPVTTKKSLFDDGYDFGDITKTILKSREEKEQQTSAFEDALTKKYSVMSYADIEKEYKRIETEEKAFKNENGGKLFNYLTKAGSYLAEGKSGQSGSTVRSNSQSNIDKINDITKEKEIINIYRKQRATEQYVDSLSAEQIKLLDDVAKSDRLDDVAPINNALVALQGGDVTSFNEVTANDKKVGNSSRSKLFQELKKKYTDMSDDELNELINDMSELRTNQINAKNRSDEKKEMQDLASENPVGAAILSRGANIIGGATGLTELYAQKDNKYGYDTNAGGFMLTNTSNDIDKQIQLDHDWTIEVGDAELDAFDFFYNTGTGIVDNLGRMVMSGGNSYIAGAMMFSQGVTQSVIEGKEKGYSDAKALTMGLLSGTFEAISEKLELDVILGEGGKALRKIAKSFLAEGGEELVSNWLNRIADEVANGNHSELSKEYDKYISEGYTKSQALVEVICSVIGEDFETFLVGGISGGVLGAGVEVARGIPTKSEKTTVNKLVEEEVAEAIKNRATEKSINEEIARREREQGGKLTEENKEALRESHKAKIESGEIELSSEELSKKEIADIRKKIKDNLKNGKIELSKIEDLLTPDAKKEINELEEALKNTKDEQKKAEIEGKIKQLESVRAENLKGQARENKYLRKAVYEKIASDTRYEDDSEITDENEKALVESAKRYANNTTETRKYVGVLRKMVRDGKRIVLTNNQELLEQGDLVVRDDITAEIQAEIKSLEKQLSEATTKKEKAKIQEQIIALKYLDVGGMVRVDENGVETIIINVDSNQAKYTVLGHEAKHTLEKYGLNKDFNKILFEYAEAKGDLDTVRERVESLYKNQKNVDIDGEVAAELTGKYLFEDEKFLDTLMKNKSDSKVRQAIEKIKELIDDLVVRFKGTEQEKQLREVQKKFTELYNSTEADIVNEVTEGTQYAIANNGKSIANNGNVNYNSHNSLSTENRATTRYNSSIKWVYDAEIFSDAENILFHEKIGEINQNSESFAYAKNTQGEYMLLVENKLVFTDGNYDAPRINKVVEVLIDSGSAVDAIREVIYDVEQGRVSLYTAVCYVQNTIGEGCVVFYTSKNNGVYGWEDGQRKGNSRREVIDNYIGMQNGTGNGSQSQTVALTTNIPLPTSLNKAVEFNRSFVGLLKSDNIKRKQALKIKGKVADAVYESLLDDGVDFYYDLKDRSEENINKVLNEIIDKYGHENIDELRKMADVVSTVFAKDYKFTNETKADSNEPAFSIAEKKNYSLTDSEGKPIDTARISTNEFDTKYSLSYNTEIAEGQSKYLANHNSPISVQELEDAQAVTNAMVDVMMKYSSILPEDKIGKVLTKNGSYDRSVENTTICVRTLAYNEFVDKVQEEIGRPLTQMESFLVSQKLYDIATEPQCLYCYVSLDRKAFNDMLLRYMQDRDTVIAKYNNSDKSPEAIDKLYEEFLNGRKDTKPMKDRFNKWLGYVDNGTQLLSLADISTEARQSEIANAQDNILKEQLKDARAYAQSASWSKIQKNYVAYRDEILKLGDRVVKNLNEHYGLRWYSFSDYSAAFIVENMQQITDASIRGLKGLSYTKDTDYAEIFAPSGMNINISVFVNQDPNGNFFIDEKQSANFEKALELREKYPNVGIVATVTNDEALRWAGEQEWSDVIIPFHIVRTGTDVAEYYKWLNYTSESGDTIADKDMWSAYLDSLNLKSENARKKVSKNIYPNEHKNDKATYLTLCESRGLSPRFVRFAGEDWYMKLVNETRLSADESSPLKPTYNLDAAQTSFQKFIDKGGYEGGWYKAGVDVDTEVKAVADDVLAGKKANEVDYGRQDGFAPENIIAGRKTNRSHSKASLAKQGENVDYSKSLQSMRYDDIAPIRDDIWKKSNTDLGDLPIRKDITPKKTVADDDIAPPVKLSKKKDDNGQQIAKILTKEPETKKKSKLWSKIKTSFIDKASPFETLALKTGNREVDAKYNSIRYSDTKAQLLIGEGADGVKALNDIKADVEKNGLTESLYDYLYHKHNVDRMTLEDRYEDIPNKAVFGDTMTAELSQQIVDEYEANNPKLIEYANDIYNYNKYLRKQLVEGGVISQETADLWEEMYPHYVPVRRINSRGLNINVPLDSGRTGVNAPIKKAKGGNTDILPLFETMAQRTLQTYKAVAKNRFGVELKNTLGTTIESAETSLDEVIDSIDTHEELLQKGEFGSNPTFTVFENGKKVTFEITDEMYDAMKPTSEGLAYTNKVANTVSNAMRGVLTEYNPTFMLTNAIKDAQDVLINSQHAVKTYKNFPKAIKELLSKGKWYTEYMQNGGADNTYFDKQTNTFDKEKSELSKVIGFPLEAISTANNFIERIPRLAEYIASRESGRSVDVSMLDAARVTTNFAAGGDVTKFLNRNGATFLNASVQGAAQQVRNIREAKANGLKGWVQLATKVALAGLPAVLLNGLLWDDDEEYEELSDYVKQNYYVVAKTQDGKFVRIPKGRALAVIQEAFTQVQNALTGDDEVDLQSFLDLAISNLAPNNPLDNNIIAPIMQVKENKTWYGEDLVPTRLQDVPDAEQYDESTDAISKWLGEKLNYSPYKINYLLNQYSGGLGDVFLPMLTPEAESGEGSFFTAPMKDKFSTDSVFNNQNTTDFYNISDELTVNANSINATDEDVLKSKYFNSISSEIGELYKEKREIQNSDLSDDLKFKQVRDIQKQINEITKNALNTYENVTINGKYANIGDRHYRLNADGEWQKITDEQLEKQNKVISILGITPSQYWGNKEEYDMKALYPEKYAVLQEQGISVKDYNDYYKEGYYMYTDDYSWASDNGGKYTISKAITNDLSEYRQYAKDLNSIHAGDDTKRQKKAYIWSLDIDEGAKLVLYKSQYPKDNSYNKEIFEYIKGRSDITYAEKKTILEELGATVDSNGNVSW